MKLKNLNVILLSLSLSFSAAFSKAQWTFLVFIESQNDLNPFALRNIEDMAKVGSNEKVNILVEWHKPRFEGSWRYRIEKGKVSLVEHVAQNPARNYENALVNSMKWAKESYPADKYALGLWNHGSGVIDPAAWWGRDEFDKDYAFTDSLQEDALFIDGRVSGTLDSISTVSLLDSTVDATQTSSLLYSKEQRGILFCWDTHTYMNNQQLGNAMKRIKKEVLGGKKLNILGMDACLMAMTEIAKEVEDSVEILIASQEVESAYGWWYSRFLSQLVNEDNVSPDGLSKYIVDTYGEFYKDRMTIYTQSATHLDKIGLLTAHIDCVVDSISECRRAYPNLMKTLIEQARKDSLEFHTPSYIDLHSFYYELHKRLSMKIASEKVEFDELKISPKIDNLLKNLDDGMKIIKSAVFAKTTGRSVSKAQGLSIYFPTRGIDRSYPLTEFAKSGKWLNFLRETLYQ